MSASVKVMLSYDYCHFEICIGSDDDLTTDDIDSMRKDAQRLADKAVDQYKIAKQRALRWLSDQHEKQILEREVEQIKQMPESERTAEQMAKIKALEDFNWERHAYDYEDDISWNV